MKICLLVPFLFLFCGSPIKPTIMDGHDPSEVNLSQSQARQRIAGISAGVRRHGIQSSILLSGISQAEAGLAHCHSEATWACEGPRSPSCNNGPVIAGKYDGPCSAQQGGLGMFQFDSGTYQQTIAQYGRDILTVEGNTAQVIPFLVGKITSFPVTANRYGVGHINSTAELAQWMNSITPNNSDRKYRNWLMLLSCLYQGSCTQSKADDYDAATQELIRQYGLNTFSVDVVGIDPLPEETPSPEGGECEGIIIDPLSQPPPVISIRSSTSADSDRVGTIGVGEKINIDRRPVRGSNYTYSSQYASNQWYKVYPYSGGSGFINSIFVDPDC